MKKNMINYYEAIILILFSVFNSLHNLNIGGLLYQVLIFGMIIFNVIMTIKFKKEIKHKAIIIIIYLCAIKYINILDSLQLSFYISNILILIIVGFMESNLIKLIALLITIFTFQFILTLPFILPLILISNNNDIYENSHYYCENNYEAYSYSDSAMDRFHYSIGKHYEFININDIIYITYNKRNEVSNYEYEEYIKNHDCKLVGIENESK